MTSTVTTAQTLAVDGINADRVRTPEGRDNMGKPRRDYSLVFAAPGARAVQHGGDEFNAVRVEIDHDSRTKAYTAQARAVIAHAHGETFVIGKRGMSAGIQIADPVPAGRYSRKALDTYAATVFAKLAETGMPREATDLADLWDSIVTAHDVPAPALV